MERKRMPNIAKVLKEEMARVARKEIRAAVLPLRKPAAATRKTIAQLKQQMAALEKDNRRLAAALAAVQPATSSDPADLPEGDRTRVTAKGLRSLRKKLRLTADEFGKLLGVTAQAVYVAEKKSGPVRLRQKTRAAYLAIRDLGARAVKERLAAMAGAKPTGKPAGRAKKSDS